MMRIGHGRISNSSRRDRKRDRRPEIVAALYSTMLRKGFSHTSLTDLAKSAGMSLSHLLYYFSSKEQVLAALALTAMEHQWESMDVHLNDPSEDRLRALADYNFGGPGGLPAF